MTTTEAPFSGRHVVICNWRDSTHPQAGGAELYCEEVARQLHDLGIRVTLLTSRPPGAPSREQVDFGTIVRLGGTYGTYLRVLIWLFLHRTRIDAVIDSENGIPYFSPLALSSRTPVVLLIHHVHQEQFRLYFPPVAATVGRWLEKWMARWVYGRRPICVVSPSARAEVRLHLAFRGPAFIAPNGLTVSPVQEHSRRSPDPRIVCVGRLVPHKRFELLIEAAPRLLKRWPDLQVHIVGDGETRPRLERQVRDQGLGDVFIFHGRVDQVERDRLIASAWLTVNPSAGEGWGLSVIEAAAHGVPAVAFHVPGLRDSVRDGSTGWLIDDGSEMAGAIEDALSTLADPQDAASWARQCREWAGSFTWESTAERILAVLVSEHERLTKRLGERRRHTDATTVVELPRAAVNARIVQRLRRSDQIRMRDEGVELLLGGADEQDAGQALERVGVPPGLIGRTRVARHYDLLGWTTQRHFRLPVAGLEVTIDEEPEVDDHGTIELEEPSGQVIELRPRLLRELERDEPTPGGPRPPEPHSDTAEEG